jgi:NAD(P)-dependent dehydrogenase (short-subunit alcohol dehydrogenase family)
LLDLLWKIAHHNFMDKPVALITGASRGLGAAFAESLAQTHHIVAVGRTTGALEELDDRIQAKGGQATLAPMDITQKEAMAHLCKSLFERWGSIDMWVHTAIHVAPLTPAATLDAKDWEKSVAVNVTATGILIPFIAPLLKDTSTALFFEDFQARQKFFSAYGASKAAQIALAQIWASEHVRSGPKIHILEPAPMPTATRARFHPGEDKSKLTQPKIVARRLLNIVAQAESKTRVRH